MSDKLLHCYHSWRCEREGDRCAHPEEVGGLELLREEVAEEQSDSVQHGHAAEVERVHRQCSGPDHVRDLRTVRSTIMRGGFRSNRRPLMN